MITHLNKYTYKPNVSKFCNSSKIIKLKYKEIEQLIKKR